MKSSPRSIVVDRRRLGSRPYSVCTRGCLFLETCRFLAQSPGNRKIKCVYAQHGMDGEVLTKDIPRCVLLYASPIGFWSRSPRPRAQKSHLTFHCPPRHCRGPACSPKCSTLLHGLITFSSRGAEGALRDDAGRKLELPCRNLLFVSDVEASMCSQRQC